MRGIHHRLGGVLPANNSVLEPELWPRLPANAALHTARILVRGDLTPQMIEAMEAQVDRAVDELMATGVDLIVYADMVTTFIMPDGWNRQRSGAIERSTGLPCISAWTAMERAISAIRPGVTAQDVDAEARSVIEAAGFGRYFEHGLGHGLGMDIHEAPRLRKESRDTLEPGMVVTVEPGIYLPEFGIRSEVNVFIDGANEVHVTGEPGEGLTDMHSGDVRRGRFPGAGDFPGGRGF